MSFQHERIRNGRDPFAPPGAGNNDWNQTTGEKSRGGWVAGILLIALLGVLFVVGLGSSGSDTGDVPATADAPALEPNASPAADPANAPTAPVVTKTPTTD